MFVISFNFRNSDVTLRGKLSSLTLEDFSSYKEVFILSTCNRFEVVFNKKYEIDEIFKVFSKVLTKEEFLKADFFYDKDAILHIFKVASSLDSMVIGETQITGQLKSAFLEGYEKGFVGKDLTRIIHFSFKCAKKVRNLTQISLNSVSVASVAIKLAKEKLSTLSGYSAIVVGAGEMAKLIAKNLVKEGVNLILVNRSVDNAVKLKDELGDEVNIEIYPITKLPKLVNNYRLLFSATTSNDFIIKKEFVRKKEFKRLWFDLAIPRDIEDIDDENIEIVVVDDLQEISNKNLSKRAKELEKANKIMKECIDDFFEYLQSVDIEPVIKFLHQKAEEVIAQTLSNALKKHFIDEKDKENIEKILKTAFKKYLHTPTKNLKLYSNAPQIDIMVSNIKKLFGADVEDLDVNKCEYHLEKGLK